MFLALLLGKPANMTPKEIHLISNQNGYSEKKPSKIGQVLETIDTW